MQVTKWSTFQILWFMTFLSEKSSYLMCWFSTSYLLHRADRTNCFPPTKCCPVWDLVRHKEDLPSQEIGSFISYPSVRKQKKKKVEDCKQQK